MTDGLPGDSPTTSSIDAARLRQWQTDGAEIAIIDLREEGQFGEGHPLLSVNIPFSRLEQAVPRMVPRLATRIVLIDGGDGVAERASRHLRRLGYDRLHILAGGVEAWAAAGHQLFESVNVPSKAFAEIVEHAYHTPAIEAEELHSLQRSGADLKILDCRTVEEFERFHVPGAISCPSAELVHRFADLVASPETFVVISCAGRTRGIIGAQTLINAGIPNRVAALSGGTQGWCIAGFELERSVPAARHEPSAAAVEAGRKSAERIARDFGIRQADEVDLARWRQDADRTTYILDVRTPEEFAGGHRAGAISAPGGQLVQSLDQWVATRGARLVLVDDTGTRATTTAHWLRQMGWEVHIASATPSGGVSETPEQPATATTHVSVIEPAEALAWLQKGVGLSVDSSGDYRRAHPADTIWTNRAKLASLPHDVLKARAIVLFGRDMEKARLAASELAAWTTADIAIVRGGPEDWQRAGLELVSSPKSPPDAERVDFLFWNHDRHDGNIEAMRAYLHWETELPARIEQDGAAGFKIGKMTQTA